MKPRLWTIKVLNKAGLCGGVDEDGGGCFESEASVSGGAVNRAVVFGGVGDAVGNLLWVKGRGEKNHPPALVIGKFGGLNLYIPHLKWWLLILLP